MGPAVRMLMGIRGFCVGRGHPGGLRSRQALFGRDGRVPGHNVFKGSEETSQTRVLDPGGEAGEKVCWGQVAGPGYRGGRMDVVHLYCVPALPFRKRGMAWYTDAGPTASTPGTLFGALFPAFISARTVESAWGTGQGRGRCSFPAPSSLPA